MYSTNKNDEDVLELHYLTSFKAKPDLGWGTWKSHDGEVMKWPLENGFISDSKRKTKLVALSEEG